MSQELFTTEKESIVGKELLFVDRILSEYSDGRASRDLLRCANYFPVVMGARNSTLDYREPTMAPAADSMLLKNINLELVATSFDEKDVVEKRKGTLVPTKFGIILRKFEDSTNGSSDKIGKHLSNSRDDNCTAQGDKYSASGDDVRPTGTKRVREEDKDEKYWKRRTRNNAAAKKSRDAKKLRFDWFEKRAKELEAENASLREHIQILTQEFLEKEKALKNLTVLYTV